ncbi:TRAP transporter large permease [Falsiroseomonas oryzae]|uniref:TRAP transporter large permease n=1 Tax=Falsiroseomonas oryzae TaxID=2766473 RepID=UPI0022EA16FF|nr:TRAP transporter large permease [Roseomonas sp. MO-31]
MTGIEIATLMVGLLIILVACGVHIALCLIAASMTGVMLITGNPMVPVRMLQSTAFQFLRDYVFAVIPLFILMGDLVGRCGAAEDMFKAVNRGLRRIPGRLAVATVIGNAIFATVTGVSVAAAAAFSRFAYPAMRKAGYQQQFAVGAIAGSAVLGMLIPPSVLMIVWGILAEQSIGQLFLAGIGPGLLLTALLCVYIIVSVKRDPSLAPDVAPVATGLPSGPPAARSLSAAATPPAFVERAKENAQLPMTPHEWLGAGGIGALMLLVLGGIWGGLFTPTEAAAIGALGALTLAFLKGMTVRQVFGVFYDTAKITAPLLLLLIAAQMYSRMLSMGGMTAAVQGLVTGLDLGPLEVMLIMVVIWLLLGMIIDSVSIMLLTVPIFWPVANMLGFDPIAFAIVGILVIECGLLTPPFGMLLFSVKSALPGQGVSIAMIVRGSLPYVGLILLTAALVWTFPPIATWIPRNLM